MVVCTPFASVVRVFASVRFVCVCVPLRASLVFLRVCAPLRASRACACLVCVRFLARSLCVFVGGSHGVRAPHSVVCCGGFLLSHTPWGAVPLARPGLASRFGMLLGVSPVL